MQIPIIACPDCHEDFTFPEWNELTREDDEEPRTADRPTARVRGLERRRCLCGKLLVVPIAMLEDFARSGGAKMTVAAYEKLYPDSERVRLFRANPNLVADGKLSRDDAVEVAVEVSGPSVFVWAVVLVALALLAVVAWVAVR